METLFLQERDVEELLTYDLAIAAVEEGFRQIGFGQAQSPPWREVCFAGKGVPHGSGPGIIQAIAYLEKEGIAVVKHFYNFGMSTLSFLRLIDAQQGTTLAVMEANYESRMRTGAAGAVAAKHLARESSQTAGLIGTGKQAKAQMEFLVQVRPIGHLLAYSVDSSEEREAFALEMETALGVKIELPESPQEVVENADILVTATPATEGVVHGEWVKEGLHITSVGADDPLKVELAPSVLARADKIVTDSEEKAFKTKQLRVPLEEGIVEVSDVYASIGEIVAGIKPGRESEHEVTVFHSTGMTVQDAALGLAIYKEACANDVGCTLPRLFALFE